MYTIKLKPINIYDTLLSIIIVILDVLNLLNAIHKQSYI